MRLCPAALNSCRWCSCWSRLCPYLLSRLKFRCLRRSPYHRRPSHRFARGRARSPSRPSAKMPSRSVSSDYLRWRHSRKSNRPRPSVFPPVRRHPSRKNLPAKGSGGGRIKGGRYRQPHGRGSIFVDNAAELRCEPFHREGLDQYVHAWRQIVLPTAAFSA